MGVLSKLKSLLGVGEETPARRGDVDVTVEREPTEARSTAAGTDVEAAPSAGVGESSAEATRGGAAASVGEAAGERTGDPVERIKGVGPSYAGRLEDAGVETVADLAERDAESLAEATGLSEKRISRWIEQAKARTR